MKTDDGGFPVIFFPHRRISAYNRRCFWKGPILSEENPMIKKVMEKLDRKYAKICVYAEDTDLVTLCAASVLLKKWPFW